MGGIVNITTRAPTETSAFATLQGFAQPYRQYGTRDTYYGYAAETGFALKQAGSPWGLRVSLRRLETTGQPQQFYLDRKSVVWGERVSIRVELGGRRIIKNKK